MAHPVIDSFSASANEVAPGQTVTLTVLAHDPDEQTLVGKARVVGTTEERELTVVVADPVQFSVDPNAPEGNVVVSVEDDNGNAVEVVATGTPGVFTFVAPGA